MKYFKVINGLIVCNAPSKNAGIELERRLARAEVGEEGTNRRDA